MTKAYTAHILGINTIDLNALPADHSVIAQKDDYVSIRVEYRGGASEYTAYYDIDDALYERDALLLNSSNPLHRLQGLLKDDLFDSKDWRSGSPIERVEWLLSMYKSKSEECDMLWGWLDKQTDEAERAEKEYHKVIQEADEEWRENGLETICSRDSFISKRLKDAGYE